MCVQWISFAPIILAPEISHQVSVESDKWELRKVSQCAEDLRRLLPAAFSIRITEMGKLPRERMKETNHGGAVNINIFNEH